MMVTWLETKRERKKKKLLVEIVRNKISVGWSNEGEKKKKYTG